MKHTLLPMAEYTGELSGVAFPVGGRTDWDLTLLVARLAEGESVNVVIETAPINRDDLFTSVTSSSFNSGSASVAIDLTLTASDVYLRARIDSVSAEATLQVMASSDFIDPQSESDQYSLKVATWKDGFERTVRQAESEVLSLLVYPTNPEYLKLDITQATVVDALKREIRAQAEFLVEKAILAKSDDPSAKVTLRSMGRFNDGLIQRLRPYSTDVLPSWYGR